MDPHRFDRFSKAFAGRVSRRTMLGGLAAGGAGAALGAPAARAQSAAVTCVYAFDGTIDVGPSSTQSGKDEVSGELTITIGPDGAIANSTLLTAARLHLAVVGQATGSAIALRIAASKAGPYVAVGVGASDIATCPPSLSGPASGPQRRDAGSWKATLTPGGAAGSAPTAVVTSASVAQPTAATGAGGSGSGTSAPTDVPTEEPTAAPTANGASCLYDCFGGTPDSASCSCTCETGLTSCTLVSGGGQIARTVCADLTTDAANCGVCGVACTGAADGETNVCVNGACATSCSDARFVTCSPDAVCKTNLLSDTAHCGACDTPCSTSGVACVNGTCADQCLSPYVTCSPDAVCKTNLAADTLHCGACGNACPGDHPLCANSTCTCQPGYASCGTVALCATPIAIDTNNCGQCGVVCGGATPQCENGACVCDEPCANGTHMNAECTFCVH